MKSGHQPLDRVLEEAGAHADKLEAIFNVPVLLVVAEDDESGQDTVAGSRREGSLKAQATAGGFGADRSWVVPIQPREGAGKRRKLSFGRADSCDVALPFVEVSKHHGFLEQVGKDWYVTDGGSTNGTVVDGQKVGQEGVKLSEACMLELGRVKARYLSAARFVQMLRQALRAL